MNDIEDDEEEEDLFADDDLLTDKMEYTRQLQDAIRRLHGCESEYAGRDDVIEDVTGPSVEDLYWSGYVEILRLNAHPEAKRCYAWSTYSGEPGDEVHYVAVLELPPVDSPHTAVRAAMIAEMKSAEEEIKKDMTE